MVDIVNWLKSDQSFTNLDKIIWSILVPVIVSVMVKFLTNEDTWINIWNFIIKLVKRIIKLLLEAKGYIAERTKQFFLSFGIYKDLEDQKINKNEEIKLIPARPKSLDEKLYKKYCYDGKPSEDVISVRFRKLILDYYYYFYRINKLYYEKHPDELDKLKEEKIKHEELYILQSTGMRIEDFEREEEERRAETFFLQKQIEDAEYFESILTDPEMNHKAIETIIEEL